MLQTALLFIFTFFFSSVVEASPALPFHKLQKSNLDPRNFEENAIFASAGDDYGIDSAFDASGNVYVVGTTYGSFPGFTSAGSYDCFIAKFNTNGVQQWVKQIGTVDIDVCIGVGVDASNNIFVVGYTNGAFSGFSNAGASDIIITKYTSAGVQTWLKQFGTNGYDIAYSVATDSSDRPIFCGSTSGAFSGFTNAGGDDAFLFRYTTAGTQSYAKQFGTSGTDRAHKVDIDQNNRNFVIGITSGTFAGNSQAGGFDSFVARYATNGNQSWLKQFGTTGDDYAWSVGVVSASGISNISGMTTGSFPGFTNAGSEDFFIARFSLTGTLTWAIQSGTSAEDQATGTVADASGNTFISGYTYGSFPGYTNFGEGDAFLAKYNSLGALTWLKQIGTAGDDYFSGINGDSTGRTYAVGSTTLAVPGGIDLNGYDVILSEHDTNGTEQWLKQFGTN